MADLPVRDDGVTMICVVCGRPFRQSGRRRYCTQACRQAAHRRRHAVVVVADLPHPHPVVYECPTCEQRYLDVRRCPDYNLFCRRLGHGGECPNCDEPVTVQDILQPIFGRGLT